MKTTCPGASALRTPTLKRKQCPECGEFLEIFSDEVSVACGRCGFTVFDNEASCFEWCRHAEACLGKALYKRMKRNRERGS